jgi:tetratricopeptide (TPR) repeat protein
MKTTEKELNLAVEKHRVGNFQDAEASYILILKIEPNNPNANHYLGVLLTSSNNPENAIPFFERALEKNNPNHVLYWLSLIESFIFVKQYSNAKKYLNQEKKHPFLEGLLTN